MDLNHTLIFEVFFIAKERRTSCKEINVIAIVVFLVFVVCGFLQYSMVSNCILCSFQACTKSRLGEIDDSGVL